MDKTDSTRWAVDVLEVRQTCHRRASRADQSDRYCRVGRGPIISAPARRLQKVKYHCRRPGADRNVGQHDVKRMSQPGAVEGILDLLPAGPACFECFVQNV